MPFPTRNSPAIYPNHPKGQVVENIMSYEVIIDIDQKDPAMLPGMTADVDIITGTKKNALYIPVEFIQKKGAIPTCT